MLVFRGKSTEQRNFSFIFIPIWPTSKLQAVYLNVSEFLRDFLLVLILALRIVITLNWTVFRRAHQYKTITAFFVTEEAWYTEVRRLIIYFESSHSFRSCEKSKKLFTVVRYTGNETRSYRHGYMTSQWINRRFSFLWNACDRFQQNEAIMSFLKKMRGKSPSKNHQELQVRASFPSPTVECAKDKW